MLFICVTILCISPAVFASPLNRDTIKLSNCGDQGDCISISTDCNNICGCENGLYYYNETLDECILNTEYLQTLTVEKYNTSEKLRTAADKVFKGIIVAVIIFITCASTCALTACVYCCRINYTDQKLQSDVKALADKLHRDGKLIKTEKKKTIPMAESCNVVVEDAGVFVC